MPWEGISGIVARMNQAVRPAKAKHIGYSACPHDCPSTCALEVELLDEHTIGRVRGAKDNDYTAGVICAKVARYAEREHHANRLLHPLRRVGEKGSGEFQPISWDDALDLVAEQFIKAEQRHGAESVWPYYYAGTMGLVMRDGIHRLRHVKKYSGFHSTICVNPAYAGYAAGVGRVAGPDPREMAKSDLVVIWGTNAVNTQVNVMTHATRARKERGAKIAAVDIYMNGTMAQADLPVLVKPGTDGALACAVMHCLFRDGKADWDYLEQIHRRAARTGGASAPARSAVGVKHHRHAGGDHRSVRQADRRHQARLLPARLRLRPLAQRPRQHARGKLHRGGDRRLAVRRGRRLSHQRRHLSARQDPDRRARRLGPFGAHARPVAHRRHPHRRQGRAGGRRAGRCADHPEHQSVVGRARPEQGQAGLRPRRSLRLRARAVHDRDRAGRRRGAAGHHLPRARRRLSRRRPPIHHPRPQAGASRRANAATTTRSSPLWPSASAPSIPASP